MDVTLPSTDHLISKTLFLLFSPNTGLQETLLGRQTTNCSSILKLTHWNKERQPMSTRPFTLKEMKKRFSGKNYSKVWIWEQRNDKLIFSSINFNNVFNSVSAHWTHLVWCLFHKLLSTRLAYTFMTTGVKYGVALLHEAYYAEVVLVNVLWKVK